jgi:hypothetical protein
MREVWEGVFHSWELLRGAHEGGQVVGSGLREEGWGEITLAPAVSRPRSRRDLPPDFGHSGRESGWLGPVQGEFR